MAADTTVRHLLLRGDFRRLLTTRLLSQFGDGVFQASLAGTVLFNPQRAADPLDVAAGFAVLLLPYSVVGPFAGVWLDRWSRRQVLLRANLLRAVLVAAVAGTVLAGVSGLPLYALGLAVFSVTRFVLSALSAGLPHTADEPSLVSANALSTTLGAVATVAGGGVAVALSRLGVTGDAVYAAVALSAALPYLLASLVVAGFAPAYLGPDAAVGPDRLTARAVVRGMVEGARHARARPPVAAALLAISAHRLCYGVLTLLTMLLYRTGFPDAGGLLPGGLVGLGQAVAAGAAGTVLAAAVTPAAVRRVGRRRWTVGVLAVGGVLQLALGLPFTPPSTVAAAFVLGLVAQGVKICVDTTLQESLDDELRGRVFSVYDTLVNVSYVSALVGAALLLPPDGRSGAALAVVAAGYLLTSALYARLTRDHAPLS
ncbi:Major Facilitator Superfamily protein [Geodermatophilus dictyosporus]|uniref:Major Facilitator Superfamily protein n=1 Tax=Geodermatophilus dictyosporus TaxID=1523247 RepID=A0A1I5S7P0_9ACTN|nr:MFS transporter [Geodermatophilus dictyosporus]SFP66730.1 Major Facilitator Superfamily protein [Geodermatophilus dictyosporus]